MRIFSNAFPTNLPDSETISQGGPANFERLFLQHIEASNLPHEWVGVMLEGVHSDSVRIQKVCTLPQRTYYRLYVPKSLIGAVVRAKSTKTDPSRLWQKPIARIERLMRAQKPDVVFLNGFGILNWMLLRAAKNVGIPVVIQHAGIWTKELNIHKDRYTEFGRRLMENMEKESSELASIEVFLNGWSRDYYRAHVATGSPRKTEVVPLPFDFASFKELSAYTDKCSSYNFDRAKRHIGIIARWDTIKNHDAVLAMAKEARRKGLPWQFHSIVEIPDTEEYRVKKAEYQKYVDVLPPADRSGISDFCRSVDLLLLPSVFDVSPTVVLEAVALGTPIAISPTVGHVRNFMLYGGSAWVIDPTDTRAAVQNIDAIMGKPVPSELQEKILGLHDHAKVFDTYLRLFAEAPLRDLPMRDVVKRLFWQELARYVPWFDQAPLAPANS